MRVHVCMCACMFMYACMCYCRHVVYYIELGKPHAYIRLHTYLRAYIFSYTIQTHTHTYICTYMHACICIHTSPEEITSNKRSMLGCLPPFLCASSAFSWGICQNFASFCTEIIHKRIHVDEKFVHAFAWRKKYFLVGIFVLSVVLRRN